MAQVIIHSIGRCNYQTLTVSRANELKLIAQFSAKEINDATYIAVPERAYEAIFNSKAVKKQLS